MSTNRRKRIRCKFYGRLGCKHGNTCPYYHSKKPSIKRREERRILDQYDCHCGVGHPIRRLISFCKEGQGWVCRGCGVIFADEYDDPFGDMRQILNIAEVTLDEWGKYGGICTTKKGYRMGIFYQKDDFSAPPDADCYVIKTRSGGIVKPFMGRGGKMMLLLNYGKKKDESSSEDDDD